MANHIKNKVAFLIAVGNTLILLLLIFIGILVNSSIYHLSTITSDLYQHPFSVNKAALVAKLDLQRIRERMLEIALTKDPGKASSKAVELSTLDRDARQQLQVVETNFLGDPATVTRVNQLLDDWLFLRLRTINLAQHGQWNQVDHLVMTANQTTIIQLNANIDEIVEFSQHKAETFTKEANDAAASSVNRVWWIFAFFATTIFMIGLSMSRRTWQLIHTEELANETVIKSEKKFHSLFDNLLEGITYCQIIYDNGKPKDFIYFEVNSAFERLTGLKDVSGKKASEVIPGILEDNPELLEIYGRVALTGHAERFETKIKGLYRWFSLSVYSVERGFFTVLFNDITERKRNELQLLLAASIFHDSSEAMLIIDDNINIISVNPAFSQITGYGADEVLGNNPSQIFSGEHNEDKFHEVQHSLEATSHWQGEVWSLKKNGEEFAAHLMISSIQAENGNGKRYAAQFTDITDKKRMVDTLSKHANFDPLTGLSNRRMFHDLLEQEIKKSNRSLHKLALMFIDLDRFKEVNDTLGHHIGDQLLVEAAQRIVSCVRESDIVSRLGGDEFTVILSDLIEVIRIEKVAHAIITSLGKPFQIGEKIIEVSASMGIAIYPSDTADQPELIRYADQAMYLSKSEGKNRFNFFTKAMQDAIHKQHQLSQDLQVALKENQFQLYFQPIVELQTGDIFKAETLLRWQHPIRGMIEPAVFISVAEDIGLIDEIGDWVFTESVEEAKRCSELVGRTFRIGINISPLQLISGKHNNVWNNHVYEMKLSGKNVSIEITEDTLLKNRQEVTDTLLTIHKAGIELAIDDFGTGFSSMSNLQKYNINYLKIDPSFTRNLKTGSNELAMSEAIILMAHKLGIKVIAEGIESDEQRELLIAAGCDFGQGYLIGKPVPSKVFEQLLKEARRSSFHAIET